MMRLLLSDMSELDLISTGGKPSGVLVKQSCLAQLSMVTQLRQAFVMIHYRAWVGVEACIVD